jgi:ATP-dependent DNA helicase PIF1
MELSTEQQQALTYFEAGQNLFLTGPGGSGKTALIKIFVEHCKRNGRKIQVCALTGCAAVLLNCQAKTVHSWAGIGLASDTPDRLIRKVSTNKYKSANWQKIDVLVVDEVSMMSQKIFEILDGIGKKTRNSTRPFGGLQLIFSGDFYQLPPVNVVAEMGNDATAAAFCFESPLWSATFPHAVQLQKIFRQTDAAYTAILNQIRVGKLYKSSLTALTPHIGKVLPETFKPTILLPRRRDAEVINFTQLAQLEGQEYTYQLSLVDTALDKAPANTKAPATAATAAKSRLTPDQKQMEYNFLMSNIMAEKSFVLKKGAQVMCIANIDTDSDVPIVNGSQGLVVDFVGGLPVIQFNNGARRTLGYHVWNSESQPALGVKQMPLIYAWAITIHKAQGVTLEMAQIDAGSSIFECGQTYVALSRIKSLAGLYLTAFDPQKIKVNRKVQEFYTTLLGKVSQKLVGETLLGKVSQKLV